jgi:hypothetical protein
MKNFSLLIILASLLFSCSAKKSPEQRQRIQSAACDCVQQLGLVLAHRDYPGAKQVGSYTQAKKDSLLKLEQSLIDKMTSCMTGSISKKDADAYWHDAEVYQFPYCGERWYHKYYQYVYELKSTN